MQLRTVQTQIADVRLRRFMAPACNVATNVIIVKCLVTCSSSSGERVCGGEGMEGGQGTAWLWSRRVTQVDCLLCSSSAIKVTAKHV